MSAVRRVNDCIDPGWDEAERFLLQLPVNLGAQVSLEVGDDHFLIIEYVENLGYFVCASVPAEREFLNLIDSHLGDAITDGDLALERFTFPRHTLVGRESMLKAAKTFFETGLRDQTCEWIPDKNAF